ncbi:MAG: hypothetical protein OSA99_10900, partial [Acidimicrobiales bacterium]|nr:hypothetical protein [Acidimicrobiales bacterium]
LNEVPWRIIDWWTAQQPDSEIASLLAASSQWTSVCPDEGHLSPWVTWPTVHRGVPNTVHGIGHFGQDTEHADSVAPTWWARAVDAGRRVGVFGLLHTNELPDDVQRYAFFVPDTFAPSADTHPGALESFQAFNLSMARASARNVSTSIDLAAARRFLMRSPLLGLRPATVARLVRQLVDERRRPHTRVRRRSYQSVLGFDLFEHQLRRTTPDAAAFFTNHVASAMHRYWAATFPHDYDAATFGFDEAWISTWDGEIAEAMGHADRMVGRLRSHCDETGSLLVVASSMGQQAAQGTPVGRQLYLRDVEAFLRDAGVDLDAVERRPAMDPHVNVQVRGEASCDALRVRMTALRVGGAEAKWTEEDDGFFSLEFGQADDAIGDVTVDGDVRSPGSLGFEIIEIEDEVASTGYHVPDGILIAYDPRPGATVDAARSEIATTEIAPLVLDRLDIPSGDPVARQ